MPYLLTLFSGGTIPTTLGDGSVTVGPGAADTRYVKLVNGTEWDAYKTDTSLVPHVTYSQTSIIAGTSTADLKAKADVWHSKAGVAGTLTRVSFDNSGTHTLPARLTNVQDTVTPMGGLYSSLDLTWESVKWPWRGANRGSTATFPGTSTPATINMSLVNNGNRAVYDGTITVTVSVGTVTQFNYWIQDTSWIGWYWQGTIVAPGTLKVDCGARTVLHNGSAAYSGFGYQSSRTIDDYIWIQPGTTNSLAIVYSPGGTATVAINTWDGWA